MYSDRLGRCHPTLGYGGHAGLEQHEEAFIGWKGETYRPRQPGDVPEVSVCATVQHLLVAAQTCLYLADVQWASLP